MISPRQPKSRRVVGSSHTRICGSVARTPARASNWRCPIGEIDLVARQGGQLVFVEVRTRRLDGRTEVSANDTRRVNKMLNG